MTATVVMARCQVTKAPFGIRMEKRGADWYCTWAYPISEKNAKKEGYDKQPITGEVHIAEGYPGCPHCRTAFDFYICTREYGGCGGVSCYDGKGHITCPSCGWHTPVVSGSKGLEGGAV
jgi:hypothetical protein